MSQFNSDRPATRIVTDRDGNTRRITRQLSSDDHQIETEKEDRRIVRDDESESKGSTETVTTASGNKLAVEVAASDQSEDNAIAPDATAMILTGVYDDSGVVPVGVGNESLSITVTRPDGTQESFSATTDSSGSATVAYDLSDSARGTGTYDVTVTDSSGNSVSTQQKVGIDVFYTSSFDNFVFKSSKTRFEFIAMEGAEGVGGVGLTLRVVDPSGTTVAETTTTTGSDGFAGLTFEPSSTGSYRVEADRNGSTVATESFTSVDIIGGGDFALGSALIGETNSYGGYLYSSGGVVSNYDFTLKFYTDYSKTELFKEKSVTTDSHGFFFIDYSIPEDFSESSLHLAAQASDGQKIGLGEDRIDVESPDSGGGGSAVQLSETTRDSQGNREYDFAPGEEIVIDIEATDDGDPITSQSIDVFLRYDYRGAPLYSTTVTTDSQGRASTSTTIPADAPDGIDLDGAVGMVYNNSSYSNSIFAGIQEYDYGFNYPNITPGGSTKYSIDVTETATGNAVEGVPYQFDAIYGGGRAGSFGTAKLVSGSDGTASTSISIPSDIGFEALANDFNRYNGQYIAAITDPAYDGTLSTNDTIVAGESATFTFSTPNDVSLSGIVFGDYPADKTYGTQFQGPGSFSLTIPSGVDSGDTLYLRAWAVDDQGTKYSDWGSFNVDVGSISVNASGEDNVSQGGDATVSITADAVDKLTITGVWTDWDLVSTNPDGGTVTDSIAGSGKLTIDWGSTQSSVAPSLTLSLKNRYVGGTYRLVVSGSNPDGETASGAALITIA